MPKHVYYAARWLVLLHFFIVAFFLVIVWYIRLESPASSSLWPGLAYI